MGNSVGTDPLEDCPGAVVLGGPFVESSEERSGVDEHRHWST